MEHITEQYGAETNLLKLTSEELHSLEPFLRNLGVRIRTTMYGFEDGAWRHVIQAENPYKYYMGYPACKTYKEWADEDMTEDAINRYKR